MLPGLTVPGSLAVLLQGFRSCFRLRPFEVFCLLAVGMITQTRLCTVTGMLIGAGMQTVTSHHRAHRFFSTHAWSADQLGLAMARLIVATLLPADAALDVAVDDSLFRRRGAKVHGTFWTHDASQPGRVTARGNRWVIVGSWSRCRLAAGRPACRCCFGWGRQGHHHPGPAGPRPGRAAGAGVSRPGHPPGGRRRLPRQTPARPARAGHLDHPHPAQQRALPARAAPTGKRGRPRTKGDRIGTPAQAAAGGAWRRATVTRYGRADTVRIAEVACLWYGAFGNRTGRFIAAAEGASEEGRQLLLFTTDLAAPAEQIITPYTARWSIEMCQPQCTHIRGLAA